MYSSGGSTGWQIISDPIGAVLYRDAIRLRTAEGGAGPLLDVVAFTPSLTSARGQAAFSIAYEEKGGD